MSGIQMSVPLQFMCRLVLAGQVGQNVTLPFIWNSWPSETNDTLVFPSDYAEFPEIGFAYRLFNDKLTHNEARKRCLESNGQLAVIDSREKVEKVSSHFAEIDQIHVGLSQDFDAEEWITVDGKSTDNLPWQRGEPRGGYRCAKLRPNGLYNFDCLSKSKYLCEFELPRNFSGTQIEERLFVEEMQPRNETEEG